jgi:hypothetical protein
MRTVVQEGSFQNTTASTPEIAQSGLWTNA